MPIEKTTINIPLTGGIDTKTAEKFVAPGSNLITQNVVMVNTGEIKKRNGYENLPTGTIIDSTLVGAGTIDSASALYSYNDRLVMIGHDTASTQKTIHGPHMFAFGEGANKWMDVGHYQPCSFTTERITSASSTHAQPSIADGAGMRLIVHEYSGHAWLDLIDKESGVKYREHLGFHSGGEAPQAAFIEDAYGQHFLAFGQNPGWELAVYSIDVDTPRGNPDDTTIEANVHADGLFDMTVVPYSAHYDESRTTQLDAYSEAVIVYKKSDGNIAMKSINGLGEVHRSIIIANEPFEALCVQYINDEDMGERIFVCFKDSGDDIVMYGFNPDFTEVVTANYVTNAFDDAGDIIRQITISSQRHLTDYSVYLSMWVEQTDTKEENFMVQHHYLKWDGDIVAPTQQLYHAGLVSKAFTYNGDSYAIVVHHSAVQSCYFLATFRDSGIEFVLPAKFFYEVAGGLNNHQGLSNIVQEGTDTFTAAVVRQSRYISASTRDKQIATVTFDMNPDPFPSVQVGPSMLIGGGIVTCFDGKSQEHGFHIHPENISVDYPASSVSGAVGDGYRSFRAVYQWIDRNGELQRSAPSEAYGITFDRGTDTQTSTARVNYLSFQDNYNKSSGGTGQGNIEIYRTVHNGNTFYLEILDRNANHHSLETLNTSGITESSDFTAQGYEILYTTGGEVPNIGPPGSKIMAARTNRVFLVPMDDPTAIWYSKPKVEGVAVDFSDEMVMRVETGGDITGLAVMDDNVIVFKEDDIYYFAGEGPNATNGGTYFSPTRRVATDVGCVNHNSIVTTNMGVLFKSRKGIYLLDRSLQTQYIGAPVEYYNQWDVVRAVLVEDKNQVRIVLKGGQPMLVWDYYHNQWSTWTNHSAKDACIHNGDFYWMTSAGQVKHETEDEYLDVSHMIPMKVRSPWIKLSGIQDFQRVTHAMILGEYRSPHTLTVRVYIDYDDTSSVQTATYSTTGGNHVAGEPYQFEFQLGRQKCQSIMFEITDGSYAGTYESVRLSAISLTAGKKKGMAKLPDRKQV